MRDLPILDLKAQLSSYREEALKEMIEVMDSQRFILGPKVVAFEESLSKYLGVSESVGVSSGTDALLVALMALDIGEGDEVIIPALSFFATAGVVSRLGATPVFVDVDPLTFNMTESAVRQAITSRTKAIIPVHLFGQTCDLGSLYEESMEVRPAIIEDSAQALGARLRGKHTGLLGDLACTSFFPSKNLGGFGDGGAVYGTDADLIDRVRILRVHGSRPKYYHRMVGGNFRLDALQAAVLKVKLPFLDEWAKARALNADVYRAIFSESGLIERGILSPPHVIEGADHVYNQFVIRVHDRDALQVHLKHHGIGTMIYYPSPLHTQPCFENLGYQVGDFPHAERSCREVLALPIYPELTPDDLNRVAQLIVQFFS